MGLYDRDYVRGGMGGFGMRGPDNRKPVGLSGISGWSFNTWIIVINVAVFLIEALIFSRNQNYAINPIEQWGHFSTATVLLHGQVWRFITFQFLHANLWHILMNMLCLFWFGPQVEQHLGSRRYLAFYLLSGCAGAGLYLALNALGQMIGNIPLLLPGNTATPLIGASAGVFGVLFALAFLRPNQTITLLLMFVLPVTMRIKTLAYALVAIALFTVWTAGHNAGGEAGHLGGAIFGAWLIRHPKLLNLALLIPLDRLKKSGHHAFKRPGQSPFNDDPTGSGPANFFGSAKIGKKPVVDEAEIDRILSKVATQGLHSLTKKERDALSKATEEKRRS